MCLLAAVVAMWVATGTTRLSDILVDDVWSTSPGFAAFVAVLIAMAGFTKSAQFPFHAWLPDAMVAITVVLAAVHHGKLHAIGGAGGIGSAQEARGRRDLAGAKDEPRAILEHIGDAPPVS